MTARKYNPRTRRQLSKISFCSAVIFVKSTIRPNEIWEDQDDAHSLIILARSIVLPYFSRLYFISCDVFVWHYYYLQTDEVTPWLLPVSWFEF